MQESEQDDGLFVPEVGPWARRKYHFLGKYLNLFSTGMKNKWPERHYIDLFAGAGFARLKDNGKIVASSAIRAARVADPFTQIHVCEKQPRRYDALIHRLSRESGAKNFRSIRGDANEVIDLILEGIPKSDALSVAFVDPFGLHFDFNTVSALADRRCDLIILMADNMDALRNWATYYQSNPNSNLDKFLGDSGWRSLLQEWPSDAAKRLRDKYTSQLRRLSYEHFGVEVIKNEHDRDIYSLIYASRHKRGLDFWNKSASIEEDGQRRLSFE